MTQYLLGYGSLIQTESKNSTYPHTGPNLPVVVTGYQRGWFQSGLPIGYSATFLGVKPDPKSSFNGVMFLVPSDEAMANYDARESHYCRVTVPAANITLLNGQPLPKAQFWIYMTQDSQIAPPSAKYPIVQSYVDIFLGGCFEIQQQYNLPNYASQCIDTTVDWGLPWMNDRVFPRRAFAEQPMARKIDQLLYQKMPAIFNAIEIE
jgi:hypothetical protein